MSIPKQTVQADKISPREFAFLAATILIWTGYVIYLGKDTSWDFRNYHW